MSVKTKAGCHNEEDFGFTGPNIYCGGAVEGVLAPLPRQPSVKIGPDSDIMRTCHTPATRLAAV